MSRSMPRSDPWRGLSQTCSLAALAWAAAASSSMSGATVLAQPRLGVPAMLRADPFAAARALLSLLASATALAKASSHALPRRASFTWSPASRCCPGRRRTGGGGPQEPAAIRSCWPERGHVTVITLIAVELELEPARVGVVVMVGVKAIKPWFASACAMSGRDPHYRGVRGSCKGGETEGGVGDWERGGSRPRIHGPCARTQGLFIL